MIELTKGVPGSGKTYRAVYSLYANFGINKDKIKTDKNFIYNNIDFAYTNINQIQTDKFEAETIKILDFEKFKIDIELLYKLQTSGTDDIALLETAKGMNLANCLIILDECHNYLGKENAALVWWLTYHRHLNQQIYLITQALNLVNAKYKAIPEFFYSAIPSSRKLFGSTMAYNQYTDSRMSEKNKSGKKKIKFIQEIYDTYHSGENQQSENLIKKFGIYAILLFAMVTFIILMIQSYWAPKTKKEDRPINSRIVNAQISKQNSKKTITSFNQNDNNIQIQILCSSSSNICIFENKSIPYKLYAQLKKDNKYKELYFEYISNTDFKKIYVNIDDKFMKLFKEQYGVQNENNTNNNNILFPSFSK